jgi:hypothetical protein
LMMIIPYFFFITFADMDSCNWVTTGIMAMWGLYTNKTISYSHI